MNDLADELLGPTPATARPLVAPLIPRRRVSFVILGEPPAHKNGYRIVKMGERSAIVKSKEAITYERDALRQIPNAYRLRLKGPVAVTMRLWYATERRDLDESLLLDVLQDRWAPAHGAHGRRELVQHGVYRNDRQVREKHVYHGIDARNPRAEITVETTVPQQAALL